VRAMVGGGHVEPDRLRRLLSEIEDQLYRFPAVDAERLRAAVEAVDSEE